MSWDQNVSTRHVSTMYMRQRLTTSWPLRSLRTCKTSIIKHTFIHSLNPIVNPIMHACQLPPSPLSSPPPQLLIDTPQPHSPMRTPPSPPILVLPSHPPRLPIPSPSLLPFPLSPPLPFPLSYTTTTLPSTSAPLTSFPVFLILSRTVAYGTFSVYTSAVWDSREMV